MSLFTLDVQGMKRMTGTLTLGAVADRPLWRVKHDAERPANELRDVLNMPEVYRIKPDHHVIFNEEMQWLWYRINFLLSGITKAQWRKLGGNALYLFNSDEGWPGHADHVNNLELDRPDPRAPIMLICGGAIVSGRVLGDRLYLDGMDVRNPLPSAEEAIRRGWYYTNVTVQDDLTIGRFPQGDGKDTFTPLFFGNPSWDDTDAAYLLLKDLDFIAPGDAIPSPYEAGV